MQKINTISFNNHYLKRKMCGIGRYSFQINEVFKRPDFKIKRNSLPDFFYKKGSVIQKIRFLALFFLEGIMPLFRSYRVHISPSYSVPFSFGNSKTIVVVHDLAFLENPSNYGKIEMFYFKVNLFFIKYSSCHIVTPSNYVKKSVMDLCNIDQGRIHVISPYTDIAFSGLDESFIHLKKHYDIPIFENIDGYNGHYLLLLSNAHPRKNINNTVAAYQKSVFFQKGIPLLVVGTFERKMEFDSGLVIAIENVSNEMLSLIYENAICLLLFSYSEGFGFPIIEAAQVGVPSLTSNITSLAEFSSPAYSVESVLTEDEILIELNKFGEDAVFRKSLIDHSRVVRETYSKNKFSNQWLELISKVNNTNGIS